MGKTNIEWTDHSWPVLNGCLRTSPGCENCYAERLTATRLRHLPKYTGLARWSERQGGPRWTGESRLWAMDLAMPLRLKKPSRIFVCDMGDLFFEQNSDEQIAAVFGVMAACQQHTFQVLTKRAKRMKKWFETVTVGDCNRDFWTRDFGVAFKNIMSRERFDNMNEDMSFRVANGWPLPNVHLGVSAEDQQRAEERIPWLLATPACIRFVSAEPLLGRIAFDHLDADRGGHLALCQVDALTGRHTDMGRPCRDVGRLDWVIVGGESGPGARQCDVRWVDDIVEQCSSAAVPVFVKQLGAVPTREGVRLRLRDRAGGDMAEWPEALRVRMWPGENWR